MNSSKTKTVKQRTLKGWLLFGAALLSFPAWMGGMMWNANSRSGWNALVEAFGPPPADAEYTHRRAVIGVIRPPNRRHVFADSRGGGTYHRGKVDYGFDERGFWMRGRFRGFTYGPVNPLYIPWSEVGGRDLLSLRLRNHPYRLYVQEQDLLDAAERYTRSFSRP